MENDEELDAVIEAMDTDRREAFLVHVRGGTSAVWLAGWLTRAGHAVTASAIEEYRVRDEGVNRRDSRPHRSSGRR